MAKHKYPGASGRESISDNLVGRQITDGSSLMTNTSFTVDSTIPDKISKKFKTTDFSDFYTIDDMSNGVIDDAVDNEIKFRTDKSNASVSLLGSLISRVGVTVETVIDTFPAGFTIDYDSLTKTVENTAYDISYDDYFNNTTFKFSLSLLYNPLSVPVIGNENITVDESSFFKYYSNYVLILNDEHFTIKDYSYDILNNEVTLIINGKPFNDTYSNENLFFRPNDVIVEKFYNNLDELGKMLLNRETEPIYTVTFKTPVENEDTGDLGFSDLKFTWPLSKDGYNLSITGLDFENYIEKLKVVSEEIDNYKSNLFVRFMSSPQLFEFDTETKKMESVFNIYGQHFDDTKKWIDNIANMRNVSYDRINNLPDIFLKNLATMLGFDPVSLLGVKDINSLLYERNESTYDSNLGQNLIEAETEFYRRILINLAYLFKSKGTRKSIKFFLKFIGAPEQLIRFNEKMYLVKGLPLVENLEDKIYNVLSGITKEKSITYNSLTNQYDVVEIDSVVNYTRENYPVSLNSNLPKFAFSSEDNIFFQKGSGWFESNLKHKSETIIDDENSDLNSRIKKIVTKDKDFTFGEDYYDVYRKLPGLDYGYEITSINSTNKIFTGDTGLVLNRKNIEIYLSPSDLIDYDLYLKSNQLNVGFGSLESQEEVSFIDFLNKTLSNVIVNNHVYKYDKKYYSLETIYEDYLNSTTFQPYTLLKISDFVNTIGPHWVNIIEQFVPATTLWTGGNLYSNSFLNRNKFSYRRSCDEISVIKNLKLDFRQIIENEIESHFIKKDKFRGLEVIKQIYLYPTITLDEIKYSSSGHIYNHLNNIIDYEGTICSNIITGLFNGENTKFIHHSYNNGCTSGYHGLPLICGYQEVMDIDYDHLYINWKNCVVRLIEDLINKNRGIISYEIFINDIGEEVIQINSIKNSEYDCTFSGDVELGCDIYLNKDIYKNNLDIEVSDKCDGINYTTYSKGSEDNCDVYSDIYFKMMNNTIPIKDDFRVNGLPLFVYENCGEDINPINFKENNCGFKLENFGEFDSTEIMVVDHSNSTLKMKINGLSIQYDTSNSYRVRPNVEYRQSYNQGYKSTDRIIVGGVEKNVSEIVVGDQLLNYKIKSPLSYSLETVQNANESNDFTFLFEPETLTVSSIECLGSVKTSKITVRSQSTFGTIVELLPSMSVLCYYRNNIDEKFKIGFKYPEEINIIQEIIVEDCCSDVVKIEIIGDYIIGQNGKKLEVMNIDSEICEPLFYYNFNFEGHNESVNLSTYETFNIIRKSDYTDHFKYDMDTTYTIISNCCPEGSGPEIRTPKGNVCDLNNYIINDCN